MSDSCTCSCAATRRRRPTATLVIASLALFMSLGGTSYAAVKAKSIGTKQLKDNAVTSGKIARNGVTASDIRAGVIDASKIRAGAVDGGKIRAGAVGSQQIADGSIGAQDIQPGSLGAREIAPNSINSQQIADQSLGLGELNQATVDLFKDVPTDVAAGGNDQAAEPISTEPTGFTTMRSFSVPAPGTGKTGTSLVQSLVAVSSTGANVTCWISVNGVVRAGATVTATGRAVIPVTTLVRLGENDVVQTRCRADAAANADTRTASGATSMTLMRVDD
jgi:hypothetical protein